MPSVFITGGTSGLGLALAKCFVASSVDVHVQGRNGGGLSGFNKADIHFVPLDFRDTSGLSKIGEYIAANQIDHFVHSAAIYTDKGSSIDTTACIELLTVNFVAAVVLLKDVYEIFKNRRAGSIAVTNSIAGINPNYHEAAYSASKHGLKGFVNSLQLDAYKHNVRIIEYYLGAMQTPMTAHRPDHSSMMAPAQVAEHIMRDVLSKSSVFSLRQEIRRFPHP